MKKIAVAVSFLALLMALTAVAPALAKDFNLPEGATVIDYWSGGICVVELTSDWPPDPAVHAIKIRIDARHHEAGTYGAHDSINIDVGYGAGWIPVTYFTTNTKPEFMTFIRQVYKGLPIGTGALNAQVVLEDNLKVERHGNRITAELKTPLTVMWVKQQADPTKPKPPFYVPIDIPPFKLELDNVGGSLHLSFDEDLTGYSNYVFYEDMMGFDGTGALTCNTWGFVNQPVTLSPRPYCGITMHGITTYFPPSSA